MFSRGSKLRRRLRPTRSLPPRSLTTCPMCRRDHVCPMEWGALDDSSWWIRLRCGDCDVWIDDRISNRQAMDLDLMLDRQQEQIRKAADRLDAERMAEQVKAFTAALRRDAVVAADF